MTRKFRTPLSLALLSLGLFCFGPSASANDSPYERIEAACQKTLGPDFSAKELNRICGCVRRNYEAKSLGEEELSLLLRSHEEDPTAEEELQKEQWQDIVLFDYDVTDGCVKKPSYRYR